MKTDPRIDAYIAAAPEYARPVLLELRRRVHAACPEIVETLKWRSPSFEYEGLLGGMAAFKRYCSFGFWKEPLLRADAKLAGVVERCGRMTSVDDLPAKAEFTKLLKRAMQLNQEGVAVPRGMTAKKVIAPHPEFARALAASKSAKQCFAAFSPSAQREYLEWIASAKQDATRARRIDQAIEWIADGKHRNWKYERC